MKRMIPLFIGGTGRSGTTILKRILASHSKVVSLPDELRVITDPGGALDLISSLSDRWSPYSADVAIQRFHQLMLSCGRARFKSTIILEKVEKRLFQALGASPRRYLGAGFSYHFGVSYYQRRLNQLIQELSPHVARGSWTGSPPFRIRSKIHQTGPLSRSDAEQILARFFQDLYVQLTQEGQTHWIDDTPYNLLYVRELLSLFPEMRLIHVFRDPRDVVASYRGFAWGGEDFVAIGLWVEGIYRRWLEIRAELSTSSFLEISLEGLAENPKTGLTRICKFIGLEFEESLMQIPLDKVHAGRWRRDIPESKWDEIETHLGYFMATYGYK